MKTKNLIREIKALRDLGHRQMILADHIIDQLTADASQETPEGADNGDAIQNIMALVEHLKANGYRAGKSKVYADRKAGLVRVNPDGTISRKAITDYIRAARLRQWP